MATVVHIRGQGMLVVVGLHKSVCHLLLAEVSWTVHLEPGYLQCENWQMKPLDCTVLVSKCLSTVTESHWVVSSVSSLLNATTKSTKETSPRHYIWTVLFLDRCDCDALPVFLICWSRNRILSVVRYCTVITLHFLLTNAFLASSFLT